MVCKNCGAELVKNAKFCDACGMENSEENKMSKCLNCDNYYNGKLGMCPNCGETAHLEIDNNHFSNENVNQEIPSDIIDDINTSNDEAIQKRVDKLNKQGDLFFLAKIALYIAGIVLIIVLCIANPKMHKKKIKPIVFYEYSQSLSVGNRCRINIRSAEYLSSVEQTVGETFMGSMHYYMVKDKNGESGVIMLESISDAEDFEKRILENKEESIEFLGEIKEAPKSISLDFEALLDSDSFSEDYNIAFGEKTELENTLSEYKIMCINLDMPMEEEVDGIGTGTILLICTVASFILGYICSYASKRKFQKAESL